MRLLDRWSTLGASGSEPECLDSSHPELNPAKHLKPYTVLSVFLCFKGVYALVGEYCFLFCYNMFYLQSFSWTSFLVCQVIPVKRAWKQRHEASSL